MDEVDEGDLLTTENFYMTCKLVGLTVDDMELLTIGACLDFADNYIALRNGDRPPQGETIRRARQNDFDNF